MNGADVRTLKKHFRHWSVGTLVQFDTADLSEGDAAVEERMIASVIGMRAPRYGSHPQQRTADESALRHAQQRAQIEARSWA